MIMTIVCMSNQQDSLSWASCTHIHGLLICTACIWPPMPAALHGSEMTKHHKQAVAQQRCSYHNYCKYKSAYVGMYISRQYELLQYHCCGSCGFSLQKVFSRQHVLLIRASALHYDLLLEGSQTLVALDDE